MKSSAGACVRRDELVPVLPQEAGRLCLAAVGLGELRNTAARQGGCLGVLREEVRQARRLQQPSLGEQRPLPLPDRSAQAVRDVRLQSLSKRGP